MTLERLGSPRLCAHGLDVKTKEVVTKALGDGR